MAKITKRLVDSTEAGERELLIWDDALPGFALRVYRSGVKAFLVQYRDENRRTRRVSLGRYGPLTPDEARTEAKKLLGDVARGGNPAEKKKAPEPVAEPTIEDLQARYLEEHARPYKKPKSVKGDEQILRDHIVPALEGRPVSSITREDVVRLHHKLKDKPIQANRALALLSKMMNLAEDWGLRPAATNPTLRVKKYRENKRQRYLSSVELARLGKVLADLEGEEDWQNLLAVRLLLLTGARSGEILTLRWEHVDMERGLLLLPESKTGAKAVPLSAAAVALLQNAPRKEGSSYVIPSPRRKDGPLTDLNPAWRRIKARAETMQDEEEAEGELKRKDRVKLADVRLHDLRHTFASIGAGVGLSLPMIGGLLGHSQAATTTRYAHLAADPLRQAADAIAGHIAAVLEGKPPAEVLKLDQRRAEK